MSFVEQSYRGSLFRPQPVLHFCENPYALIIATPWGERKAAHILIEELINLLNEFYEDEEKTTFHRKLPYLGKVENHLRSIFLQANEKLYKENEKSGFNNGIELLVVLFYKGTMYWIQYGAPNLFIYQAKEPFLQPFLSVNDWSQHFSPHKAKMPPLPRYMLGLHSHYDIKIESLSISDMNPSKDGLVFLTSPYVSSSFYGCSQFTEDKLAQIVHLLSANNGDYPFWLGAFSFKALPFEFFSQK